MHKHLTECRLKMKGRVNKGWSMQLETHRVSGKLLETLMLTHSTQPQLTSPLTYCPLALVPARRAATSARFTSHPIHSLAGAQSHSRGFEAVPDVTAVLSYEHCHNFRSSSCRVLCQRRALPLPLITACNYQPLRTPLRLCSVGLPTMGRCMVAMALLPFLIACVSWDERGLVCGASLLHGRT
jgi:hypothetical protein